MYFTNISYVVYGLAVAAYLSIGAIHWGLGRRSYALYYFEQAVSVFIYIAALLLIEALLLKVEALLGAPVADNSVEEALRRASQIFDTARQRSLSWILTIASLRAALSIVPVTSPLSYVLGSATGWSMSVFNMCAVSFLFYMAFAKVFEEIHPYLASLGAIMTPIPRLRSIGAAMLSADIVFSTAIIYYSGIVSNTLENIPSPPSLNPVDWMNIAGMASNAAIPLAQLLVKGVVIMSIASALSVGFSKALSGVYFSVKIGA